MGAAGPPDDAAVIDLREARTRVTDRIGAACSRSGRDPASVTLVAVSKTVPAERLRAAMAAGIRTFGENRVQEALAKIPELPGAAWHLVGPLQSNKARAAVDHFDMIETIHGVALARRLDGLAAAGRETALPVLLQVNVDGDPAKSGFRPEELDGALTELADLGHLRLGGLMTVGRLVATPTAARATFVALRRLSDDLRGRWPTLGPELSMGMSDDFDVAVEEGATIVRVGRALFGERSPVG